MQDCGSAHSCFVTGRHQVILVKSALKHMFKECLLDYLAKTIIFINWTACGILKYKMKYLTSSWSGFQMFNKQGMIFYVASAMLANGRYPYIYSLAVVKESASNRFTNCHTYYFFHFGSETQNIPVSDWKKLWAE